MTNEELLKVIEEAKASGVTALDLSNKGLTRLPPEIGQLPNLKELRLDGNHLVSPPREIAELGIEAIRQYFACLQPEEQPLNEVKIIFIGDGAAGKTSLVNQLFGQAFNQHEEITHGIRIMPWYIESGSRRIKVNIWDFGGQEIMHATHQFFLSKRSLYVLVLDGRKDERTEYWLRYIESFGGNSPVLIVLNKQDANPSFDLNRPFLLVKYPSIKGFFRTSCKTGRGIAHFKDALISELGKVPMIAIRWPKTWFAVKQRIEQMDKPYISVEEYSSICAEAGLAGEDNRETLVDLLHDLGVAMHFKEYALNDMHILNPIWVTNAVYTIINAPETAYNNGILSLNSLGAILRQRGVEQYFYPAQTHMYLLELMKKFELCYELDRDSVLIPQMLPISEPPFSFDYSSSLGFALHYPEFLPPSVFPRFMVKVHRDIKAETCWRTGVLLEDQRSGAQALVKADIEARRINIWVNGAQRREYLHYLRYTLADINSGFEKLAVSERIPMPDDPQRTADYQTLLNYAEHGVDVYFAEGSKKRYSVHELLGLVQPKDRDELAELVQKVREKSDEKLSTTGLLNELVEPKISLFGITFDLSSLFEGIRSKVRDRVLDDPSREDKNE